MIYLKRRFCLFFGLSFLFLPFFDFVLAEENHSHDGGAPINPQTQTVVADVKKQLEERSNAIKNLEREIKIFDEAITTKQTEAKTLSQDLQFLNNTQKKLSQDLFLTQSKISVVESNLKDLETSIANHEKRLRVTHNGLSKALKEIRSEDEVNLVEVLLRGENLSTSWEQIDRLVSLEGSLSEHAETLRSAKESLTIEAQLREDEKLKLKKLENSLDDQRLIVLENSKSKDRLLKDTKSEESAYQKLRDTRLKQKLALEQEINDLEAKLKTIIDTGRLPKVGKGVLRWPVDVVRITQYFGQTEFATKNPQVYRGKGHNGVDFGVSVGTPILASASGVVKGFGDTDVACYRASYGKWILVEHGNGLSTLYAHLSLIKVKEGEKVSMGDIIGYSGNTGYSTGPHLHFSVYASQGVQIDSYKSRACGGKTLRVPLAPQDAYLNPLSYL